jgi:uncharacterized protein (TIGR02145 family)
MKKSNLKIKDMKPITSLLTIILLSLTAITIAQVPQAVNFQAIARDATGNVMVNTPIQIQLSILDNSSTGPVIYKELRALTTNAYGSFSFQIGIDPYATLTGKMEDINWLQGRKFLKIDYDPTNQLQFSLTLGIIEFVSVPYAFAAGSVSKIDASNAKQGDVLQYNASSGNFEPAALNIDWNDTSKYLKAEIDPVFNASVAKKIKSSDTVRWSAKSSFSGRYTDLTNKPTTIAGYGITDAVTTTGDQTIAGHKTFSGTVTVAAPVNNSDATNKAYTDEQIALMGKRLLTQAAGGPVTDYDGNVYNTVKIGTQVWMAENLKTTHYSNGEAIPKVTDNAAWINLSAGAMCYYNNDSATNAGVYGALYNWYAVVDSRNLCPAGWHSPTDDEWHSLMLTLDATAQLIPDVESATAGGHLKETGFIHWFDSSLGDNSSGFTAVPGGYRNGIFTGLGSFANFWSSTDWCRVLCWSLVALRWHADVKVSGFSVRCVR